MPFARIEMAFDTCDRILSGYDKEGMGINEFKSYIVAGLVVLIVSEYEDYLEKLFCRRAELCGDRHVISYVRNMLSQRFRSPDLGKINEILKCFDEEYRKNFFSEIENSISHAAWDSIMKARHAVVHKKGTLNVTYSELKEFYPHTKAIVHHLEAVLGLT